MFDFEDTISILREHHYFLAIWGADHDFFFNSKEYISFLQIFILQIYDLLLILRLFLIIEIRKNLDLRKIFVAVNQNG
jgi:hypothetical protein